MTQIVTMGTKSCAAIALAGFGGEQQQINEQHIKGEYPHIVPNGESSAQDFWDNVLMPLSQPLGESAHYPFDMLMDIIDEGSDYGEDGKFKGKFIIVTLNDNQYNYGHKYWPKRLAARGFTLIDKTDNTSGMICYFFTRNNRRVDI